jgi:hypothetical protein
VRLAVPLAAIGQCLISDVISGRRDDLWKAASQIAASEAAGVEDVVFNNDRPIGAVARDVTTYLGRL